MTRPTDDLEWATDGGASVTEPPALKKTQGWIFAEKPPAAWLNWLLRAVWRWVAYLDARFAAILTAAGLTEDNTDAQVVTAIRTINAGVSVSGVANELTDASFNGLEEKDVSAQAVQPYAVRFSTDGLKMYVLDLGTDTIYQYTLTTAWDVTTASYATKSLSVTAQEATPTGLAFSADGTKVYICGATNDTIYQYTLSTAWDLSTGAYASKSLSVAAQDTSPSAVFLSADGTKAYVLGQTNDKIFQYTLSTAWDISTGSYATKSLVLTGETTTTFGADISSDGTKICVSSEVDDTLYLYTLSTPWDVSTGSYATQSTPAPVGETLPTGVCYRAGGADLFLCGNTNNKVYRYRLTYTYAGRMMSWFAGICWNTGATAAGTTALGPNDNTSAVFLGGTPIVAANNRFQVHRAAAGTYYIELPDGYTCADLMVVQCFSATAATLVAFVDNLSTTRIRVSVKDFAGVGTDAECTLQFALVREV